MPHINIKYNIIKAFNIFPFISAGKFQKKKFNISRIKNFELLAKY